MTTLEIQRRLKALGHDPGPLDGIFGALTRKAVAAFQRARGIPVSWPASVGPGSVRPGSVGPMTIAALEWSGAPATGGPHLPWLEAARRLQGTREIVGKSHSPVIMGWAKRLGLRYPADETPWCGLFIAHCIGATLPDEAMPANPLGARNWLKFGVSCEPQLGAVLVFSRPGASWSGHVGFYAGEDGSAFSVLGGNQSNSVNVARVARSRLLGARWPGTVAYSATGKASAAGSDALSINEA